MRFYNRGTVSVTSYPPHYWFQFFGLENTSSPRHVVRQHFPTTTHKRTHTHTNTSPLLCSVCVFVIVQSPAVPPAHTVCRCNQPLSTFQSLSRSIQCNLRALLAWETCSNCQSSHTHTHTLLDTLYETIPCISARTDTHTYKLTTIHTNHNKHTKTQGLFPCISPHTHLQLPPWCSQTTDSEYGNGEVAQLSLCVQFHARYTLYPLEAPARKRKWCIAVVVTGVYI
jgi:hypothetical protein